MFSVYSEAMVNWGLPGGYSDNTPANAGDIRDVGLIPVSERSPGRGRGNPFQYSCLENLMDRRAWLAPVYRVAKNQIQVKQLTTHGQLAYTSFCKGIFPFNIMLSP